MNVLRAVNKAAASFIWSLAFHMLLNYYGIGDMMVGLTVSVMIAAGVFTWVIEDQ